jgi:hypothetical protein
MTFTRTLQSNKNDFYLFFGTIFNTNVTIIMAFIKILGKKNYKLEKNMKLES